jgi:hypothetical protein
MANNLYKALFAAALCAISPSVVASPLSKSPVTITTISYDGWQNCTEISNGIVEAIVVPQIGRIMAFHFVDDPKTDPLFVNPDWQGKTGADSPAGSWANFGGDKLWPSEQANWPEYIGHTWPPDTAFDGQPLQLSTIKDGVVLTTPVSTAFGAQAERSITLRPGESRLYISQTLKRTSAPSPTAGSAPAPNGTFAPIGIWSITQSRPDATVFLPLSRKSAFPTGLVTFDSNSQPINQTGDMPGGWTNAGKMLTGHHDPINSHKLGTDSRAGWLASLYDNDIVFSEHYKDQPHGQYPDRGCRNEVYVSADPTAYFEFEVLGPVQYLEPGEKATYNIYWQLDRLSKIPIDDHEAAALVRSAMKGS